MKSQNHKSKVTANFYDVSYSGYGVGTADSSQEVYAWNAFPGEQAEVELFSQRQPLKGTAIKILKPSIHRIDSEEGHFFVSAPWQVIDYKYEVELKRRMFEKIWQEQVGLIPEFSFVKQLASCSLDEGWWYYRNTMEFNVMDGEEGLQLALLFRGRQKLMSIKESKLVYPVINKTVWQVLEDLKAKKIRADKIKQIIVRANRKDEVMAGVYSFDNKLIYSTGPEFLEEKIGGLKFRFGLNYFWQPNITLFEQALMTIKKYVQNESVIDMYSGVGVIGLSLASSAKEVWLIEKSKDATKQAQENMALNNIKNAAALSLLAEEALKYITPDKTVVFDPPRSGLDNKIIGKILQVKPKKIIYLSCKPYTQCLDIKNLLDDYKISHTSLYNFFPRTPHLESLIVLEKM